MKQHVRVLFVCCLLLTVLAGTAYADAGPKPSVTIRFSGIQDVPFYATLLSEESSTGPDSVWNGDPAYARYAPGDDGYEIWLKFVDYKDTDGFYFLQNFWDCTESQMLDWNYYPPSPFKILLYFPERQPCL